MKKVFLTVTLAFACLAMAYGQEVRIGEHVISPPANAKQLVKEAKALRTTRATRGGSTTYQLVQFSAMPTAAERAALERKGVKLHDYVGGNAYYAAFAPGEVGRQIEGSKIRSVIPIEGAWKVASRIAHRNVPDYAREGNDRVRVSVRYHGGATPEAIARELASAGLPALRVDRLFGTPDATLTYEQIEKLASLPSVASISLVRAPMQLENRESRSMGRVNIIGASAKLQGRALTGRGVKVGIWDANVEQHVDFGSRINQREFETSVEDSEGHGVHVAGTLAGAGLLNPRGTGMAPGAILYTRNFNEQSNGLIVEQEMMDSHVAEGITITQNSYGLQLSRLCSRYDIISYNAAGSDYNLDLLTNWYPTLTHVFAAGNDQAGCAEITTVLYGQAGYGTSAKRTKNVLFVGAVDERTNMTSFSSWGPMDDGRLIPTVSANGNNVFSTLPKNTYGFMGGTSMSCPAASGLLALVSERYAQLHQGEMPRSALLRALAANTADDRGNPGPDYQFGYGILNAEKAVVTLEKEQYKVETLKAGETKTHSITVPANAKAVRIMIAWNDTVANKSYQWGEKALINDLNLRVKAGGTPHFPWVLDPQKPALPATRGVDNLNNIEQVLIDNPTGDLTVTVDGSAVASSKQEYALVWWFDMPDLRLVAPYGGERYSGGDTIVARWEYAQGPATLEISYDDGKNYTHIVSGVKASQIPVVLPDSINAKVRMRVFADGQVSASTLPFILAPQATNLKLDGTTLKWEKPKKIKEDKIKGYRILRADADKGVFYTVKDVDNNTTSHDVKDSIFAGVRNVFTVEVKVDDNVYGPRAVGVLAENATRTLKPNKATLPIVEDFSQQPPKYFSVDAGENLAYQYAANPLIKRCEPGAHILYIQAADNDENYGDKDKPFDSQTNILTLRMDELDLSGFEKDKDSVWMTVALEQQWDQDSDSIDNNMRLQVTKLEGQQQKAETVKDARGREVLRPEYEGQTLRTVAFNLNDYLGSKVKLELQLSIMAEDLVCVVESIRIEKPLPKPELELLAAATNPKSGPNLGEATLYVAVGNNSPWNAKDVKVGYSIDSGTYIYETIPEVKAYQDMEYSFAGKLDLSTTRDSGQVFTITTRVDDQNDPVPTNNTSVIKVTNMGNIMPHPKGGVLEFFGFLIPVDPKETRYVEGRTVYTDNGGYLGTYPKDDLSTLKLLPATPGKALQLRLISFNTNSTDTLKVYTQDVPTNLSVNKLTPDAKLAGEVPGGTVYISSAIDGGIAFQFASGTKPKGDGWAFEVLEIDRPNTFTLQAPKLDLKKDEQPLKASIVNHSPIDHSNVGIRYILNNDTVSGTIAKLPAKATIDYTFDKKLWTPDGNRYNLRVELLTKVDMEPSDNAWDTLWLKDSYCQLYGGSYPDEGYIMAVAGFEGGAKTKGAPMNSMEYRTTDTLTYYSNMPDTILYVQTYAGSALRASKPKLGVWVDWNRDHRFTDDERVDSASLTAGKVDTSELKIPLAGHEGNYRLRVVMADHTNFKACDATFNYGDAEDYTLCIKPEYPIKNGVKVEALFVTNKKNDFRYTKEEKLAARVKNLGSEPITKLEVALTLDGEKVDGVLKIDTAIAAGATIDTVEFEKPYDLSKPGAHRFVALVDGMEGQPPDTVRRTVITVKPYSEDSAYCVDINDQDGRVEAILLGRLDEAIAEQATFEAWINWRGGELGNIYNGHGLLITAFNRPEMGYGPENSLLFIAGNTIFATPANSITPGKWQHIAVTHKTSGYWYVTTKAEIYINGEKQKLTTLGQGGLEDDDSEMNCVVKFGGLVDNLRVWKKQLTEQEIKDRMYKAGKFDDNDDLVVEFTLDEGPNNIISVSKKDGSYAQVYGKRLAASDTCMWVSPVGDLIIGTEFTDQVLPSEKVGDKSFKATLKHGTELDKVKGSIVTSWPQAKVTYNSKEVGTNTEFDFKKGDATITVSAKLDSLFGKQTFEEKDVKIKAVLDKNFACELTALSVKQAGNAGLTKDATVDKITSAMEVDLAGMTDLSKVVLTFTVSTDAALKWGDQVLTSGTSAVDLRKPIALQVVAANGRDSKFYTLAAKPAGEIKWELAKTEYTYGDAAVKLTATGPNVDFVSSDVSVVTIAGGKMFFVGQGKATVSAISMGDTTIAKQEKAITVKRKEITVKPVTDTVAYTKAIPEPRFDFEGLVREDDGWDILGDLPEYKIYKEGKEEWDATKGYLPVGTHTRKPVETKEIESGNYKVTPKEGNILVVDTAVRKVVFTVTTDGTTKLEGVTIRVNDVDWKTTAEGTVSVDLPDGEWPYEATKEEYKPYAGVVKEGETTIAIVMPKREFTITYSVANAPTGNDKKGSIVGLTPQKVALDEETVPVTAAPIKGWLFDKWDDESLLNPRSDKGKETKEFKVSFKQREYTLTYRAGLGGKIKSGDATQTVKYGEDGTKVVVEPIDANYYFARWSDGATDPKRTDKEIVADAEYEAQFSNIYSLPYSQNFEQSEGTPEGWFNYADGATSTIWSFNDRPITVSDKSFGVGSGRHAVVNSAAVGEEQIRACLQTPRLNIKNVTGDSIKLSFRYSLAMQLGQDNQFYVQYQTDKSQNIGYTTSWKTLDKGNFKTDTKGTTDSLVNLGVKKADLNGAQWITFRFYYKAYWDWFVMVDDVNVTADMSKYDLLYIAGEGGTVNGKELESQQIDKGQKGKAVKAKAKGGFQFVKWSDGKLEAERVDETSIVVTALFESLDKPATFELVYKASDNGSIVGSMWQPNVPEGTSGSPVQATPNEGFRFEKWSDELTEATRQDNKATNVTALFRIDKYTVTYVAGEGGRISGQAVQTLDPGTITTPVTATANSGYRFVAWSDGSTKATRTDTASVDKTLTATFEASTPVDASQVGGTLAVSPNPTDGIARVTLPASIPEGVTHVELYNAIGVAILRVPLTEAVGEYLEIDLTNYPTGIYMVVMGKQHATILRR